ncbi:hypothetical protein DV532_25460 (plasmid) [Pseudomonas sp. Leaf58]|uniref:hypothetical protein n=1 Tax=Pseudomonas sp. Leaf58 TaxID=1736226 RepID=UPI000701E85F|nr:hypothetical protein [Pseudomonas sp. Leaf58]AYG47647.1 hypothetical protein DV532_25460 [Pseudomonas sp. Leaf58]
MLLHTFFEWMGAATGIAGAAMVASHSKYSPYGWISFLVSSSCMSVFAVMTQAWGLLLLESCFILTNLLGLWRGLIQPFVRKNSSRHGEEATPPEPAPTHEL